MPLNACISAKATMVMQSQGGLELVAEMPRSRKNTTAGAWVHGVELRETRPASLPVGFSCSFENSEAAAG